MEPDHVAPQPSAYAPAAERPSNWPKRVSAAYLRLIGATQVVAAEAEGVSDRTIRSWESHPSWPEAQAEARSLWLDKVSDAARATLHRSIKAGDAQSARWLLERVAEELGPPIARIDHRGRVAFTIEDLLDAAEAVDEGHFSYESAPAARDASVKNSGENSGEAAKTHGERHGGSPENSEGNSDESAQRQRKTTVETTVKGGEEGNAEPTHGPDTPCTPVSRRESMRPGLEPGTHDSRVEAGQ